MKKCIACAEQIQDEALLCKHCKTDQQDSKYANAKPTVSSRPKRQVLQDFVRESSIQARVASNSSDWVSQTRPNFDRTCRECGSKRFIMDRRCPVCGLDFEQVEESTSQPGSNQNEVSDSKLEPSSRVPEEGQSPACAKCGSEIGTNATECAECNVNAEASRNAEPKQVDNTKSKVLLSLAALGIPAILLWGTMGSSGSSLTSASSVCSAVSSVRFNYFNEFNAFRYSADDGTGWVKLEQLTSKAVSELGPISRAVSNGISWDSGGIISGNLNAASQAMSEIVVSANRGYFAPGRDLEALLNVIESNLLWVESSACG